MKKMTDSINSAKVSSNSPYSIIDLLVLSILPYDPETARGCCRVFSLDFDHLVIDLAKNWVESGNYFGDDSEANIRTELEGIDPKKRRRLIEEFADFTITEKNLRIAASILPCLVAPHRQEVIDLLVSPEVRVPMRPELEAALPGLQKEVISALNASREVNNWSDQELTSKISDMSRGRFYHELGLSDKLYDRFMAIKLYELTSNVINDSNVIEELKIKTLPDNRRTKIVKHAVKKIAVHRHFVQAAKLAKTFDLLDLAISMAGYAYYAFYNRKQYKDAALIAEAYGIADIELAANRELKRLDENQQFKEAVEWAKRFGLPLPTSTANWLVRFGSEKSDQDLLLQTDTDLAKRFIQHRLAINSNVSNYLANLSLFSDNEIINDLGHCPEVGSGVRFTYVKEELKANNREVCIEELTIKVIKNSIDIQVDPSMVEAFVKEHSPGIKKTTLISWAYDIALEKSKQNRWESFLAICKAWGFADLVSEFEKIKELLPVQGKWQDNSFLFGAVLNFDSPY